MKKRKVKTDDMPRH